LIVTDPGADLLAKEPALWPVFARVVTVASASLLLTSALAAAGIAWLGHGDWWIGWSAALIVTALATGLSLTALALAIPYGMHATAQAYLASIAIRTLVTLGGCVAVAILLRDHAAAMLIIVIPFYFAQMLSEAITLAIAFRSHGNPRQTPRNDR
jgi:hypothetical protein